MSLCSKVGPCPAPDRPCQGAGHTGSHDGASPTDPAQTLSACRPSGGYDDWPSGG